MYIHTCVCICIPPPSLSTCVSGFDFCNSQCSFFPSVVRVMFMCAVRCSVFQCVAVYRTLVAVGGVLQCVAVCCSVLKCGTVRCNVLRCIALSWLLEVQLQ